jgi:hypothetical protein
MVLVRQPVMEDWQALRDIRLEALRLPPTSAAGADVTADAACPGAPVIVGRYLAHNEVTAHGNPDAGPAAGLRLLPGCVRCSARTG